MSEIYDVKTFELHRGIGHLIKGVRAAMIDGMERELAHLDITPAQFVIMARLAEGDTDSVSMLCKDVSYDPGAMTRMIDRLEAKGFIRRVRSTEDRRTVKLELTAEGRKLYPQLMTCAVNVQNALLRGFTKTEVGELEKYLRRMLANA
jgi:DNA-binding MarR family transcriptional regulator